MIELNLSESTLVMLIKNAEYQEDIEVFERDDFKECKLKIVSYDFLLQYYTKNICSVEYESYKHIEQYFMGILGDILWKIDPIDFKKAVYDSQGITTFTECSLLEMLVHKIRVTGMDEIKLHDGIKSILKGKYV